MTLTDFANRRRKLTIEYCLVFFCLGLFLVREVIFHQTGWMKAFSWSLIVLHCTYSLYIGRLLIRLYFVRRPLAANHISLGAMISGQSEIWGDIMERKAQIILSHGRSTALHWCLKQALGSFLSIIIPSLCRVRFDRVARLIRDHETRRESRRNGST